MSKSRHSFTPLQASSIRPQEKYDIWLSEEHDVNIIPLCYNTTTRDAREGMHTSRKAYLIGIKYADDLVPWDGCASGIDLGDAVVDVS